MLNTILGSRISRSRKSSTHLHQLPAGAFSQLLPDETNADFAIMNYQTTDTSKSSGVKSRSLFNSSRKKKTLGSFQDKLHQAVQAIETTGRVDPYRPDAGPQILHGPPTLMHYQGGAPQPIASGAATSTSSPTPLPLPVASGDEWAKASETCSQALACAQILRSSGQSAVPRIKECVDLLSAQSEALDAISMWAEGKPIRVFGTLAQVYTELQHGFEQIIADPTRGGTGAVTVHQVLREGPEYLIDVGLMECVVWQTEVIDPGYGSDVRNLLDDVVAEQLPLEKFRRSLGAFIQTAVSVPKVAVDDDLGQDACEAIEILIKQLTKRLRSNPGPSTYAASSETASSSACGVSVPASPTASSPGPSSPTSPAGYTPYDAQALQDRYGTGPLPPGASSYFPPPASGYASPYQPTPPDLASPTSTSSSQKSIFEYRGQRLTRSALELVQTQERLAMADSSGQYAGNVSWDDLRNAWIPHWAEKLRPGDVAEGEMPDTNPDNYRVKERDEWGNKIGWYEGRMYYHEEPSFNLRE